MLNGQGEGGCSRAQSSATAFVKDEVMISVYLYLQNKYKYWTHLLKILETPITY
jgi:hypothetical protein